MATSFTTDQLRDLISQERWPEAISLLKNAPASKSAELFGGLTDEQQQALFPKLPIDLGWPGQAKAKAAGKGRGKTKS